MSSDSITAVVINKEYKIAHFSRGNGYPDVKGLQIRSFLSDERNIAALKKNLLFILDIDPNEKNPYIVEHDDILSKIAGYTGDHGQIYLLNSIELAYNPEKAEVEYLYVIDLDLHTFEIYVSGCGQVPQNERFYKEGLDSGDAQPVRLLKAYSFADMPDAQGFEKDFMYLEEELWGKMNRENAKTKYLDN